MKNESQPIPERIQVFARELALSLRRIMGRIVEPDLPPVVLPIENQDEPAPEENAR